MLSNHCIQVRPRKAHEKPETSVSSSHDTLSESLTPTTPKKSAGHTLKENRNLTTFLHTSTLELPLIRTADANNPIVVPEGTDRRAYIVKISQKLPGKNLLCVWIY